MSETSQTPKLMPDCTNRLVRLDDYTWVRADLITAIKVHPSERSYSGNLRRARVYVHHGASNVEVVLCNDDAHAVQTAENITAQIILPNKLL
jgi:hypothetical protein